jgi:hypothetical protein
VPADVDLAVRVAEVQQIHELRQRALVLAADPADQ